MLMPIESSASLARDAASAAVIGFLVVAFGGAFASSVSFAAGAFAGVHPVRVHRADDPEVNEEAEGGDDREVPVDLAREAPFDRKRELRTPRVSGRRDELEEQGGIPERHPSSRLRGEDQSRPRIGREIHDLVV
jgi:hypothetical protein